MLKKQERKIRTGGAANTGIVLRIARKAREEDNGKVGSEVAVHGAEELLWGLIIIVDILYMTIWLLGQPTLV